MLFSLEFIPLGGADLIGPDIGSCSAIYGILRRAPCEVALEGMPTGSIPSIFTTRTSDAGSNFVTVPKRYVDAEVLPRCAITIDLDGHSRNDVFVLIPWKKIRSIVEDILDDCVDGYAWGGFETWGLKRPFDAVINPTLYNPNNPVPAQVEQPDGTLDTSVVAIPPGDISSSGYGNVLTPRHVQRNLPLVDFQFRFVSARITPKTYWHPKCLLQYVYNLTVHTDIPLYMLVTVSGPRARLNKRGTDFPIGLSLRDE